MDLLPYFTIVSDAVRAGMNSPGLTFAVALAGGIVAQTIAHHLRMPGIVLFLAVGVLLGPDVAHVVRPETLGTGLETLVGLAVAVILFEGGLNLNLDRLRKQATVIRRLVTIGALITAVGGALSAKIFMGWSWRLAIIFGTLVIVTGPTVIAPLVRRIRVNTKLQTILEAEGVLIDPIGAIIAVVSLEVLLAQSAGSAAAGLVGLPSRLVVGAIFGAAGGFAIAFLLRDERIIPDNIQNVFTLAFVLALFAVSESILSESGIMAAPVAGLVVANMNTRIHDELKEFKEELTVLFVGMLFVLLAADVRVADVTGLGAGAWWTIGLLMLVVRPVNVAVSTRKSGLSLKERGFIAWIGPRGIVAAAVASLFAQRLTARDIPGGSELQAMVFLVIAATVVVQGLSGGLLASALGLRRKRNNGYAIVGANPLGRALATILRDSGHEVVLIDTNAQETAAAKEQGFSVIFGNANEERTLLRGDIESRRGVIALTGNEGANLLIANRVRDMTRHIRTCVTVERGKVGVMEAQVRGHGHRILFGRPIKIEHWHYALLHRDTVMQSWRFAPSDDHLEGNDVIKGKNWAGAQLLPLAHTRKRRTEPVDDRVEIEQDDVVVFVSVKDQAEAVWKRLIEAGWVVAEPPTELPDGKTERRSDSQ